MTSTATATPGTAPGADPQHPTTRPLPAATGPRRLLPVMREPLDGAGDAPLLDVVIPVHNEQDALPGAVRRLHAHLAEHFPHPAVITVADNASTDATPEVAQWLAEHYANVRVVRLEEKGRGRALRTVWSESPSAVLAYMDVDLATDLSALGPLVVPLISGHSDVAVGTRLARGSRVVRAPKRELISRCYNLLLRGSLGARFSDAQCGFKAVRADVARQLLPWLTDDAWFFDTELLVLAERTGMRITEVPVDWTDDPDSSVDIVRTATDDVKGILRIGRDMATGRIPVARLREEIGRGAIPHQNDTLFSQVVRFGVVGVASTLAYLLLFVGLQTVVGSQAANLIALLSTAVANTAVNRFFTFGVTGRAGVVRHHGQGLVVFAVGLALTSGALWLLEAAGSTSRLVEVLAVVAANLAATLVRFLLLRLWVFRPARSA